MRHPSFRHLNRNHGGNELEVHAGETVGEHNCLLVADLFFLALCIAWVCDGVFKSLSVGS